MKNNKLKTKVPVLVYFHSGGHATQMTKLIELMGEKYRYYFVIPTFILATFVFLLGRCGLERRPNIFLITVDTLRADHLTCYGYSRDTSPCISRFASEARLFENCLSHAPDTRMSFASMMTGFLPMQDE